MEPDRTATAPDSPLSMNEDSRLAEIALLLEARDAARSGRAGRIRRAAGLSQGEVAATVGVTPACISRWEAGARSPRGAAAVEYGRLLRGLAEAVTR